MSGTEKKWFTSIFEDKESLGNPSSTITTNPTNNSSCDDEPKLKKPKLRRNSNNQIHENVSKTNLSETLSAPPSCSGNITTVATTNPPIKINFKSANWCENFAPKTIDDLAVHLKKIEELQNWLTAAEQQTKNQRGGCSSILLITGPPGSGKTATVQVIANNMCYTVNEWINSVDSGINDKNNDYMDDGGDRSGKFFAQNSENQCQQFSQFLFQASRYKSLYDNDAKQKNTTNKRLILVEDFPNIFLKNVDEFHEILGNYMNYGKCPLIFIVAETKSKKLDLTYSLFDDLAKQKFQISQINFNPISSTLMKKGLKRICSLTSQKEFNQYYKSVTQDLIESLILTAQGDIRNAVINLHFGSLKNSGKLSTTGEMAACSSGNSKKCKSKSKLKSVGCDETITLMHALGRVFNPKYEENLTKNSYKKLVHSPEKITDDFLSQPTTFLNLLHTNYIDHCTELADVAKISNMLSFANIVMEKWMDDSMTKIGLNIAIGATMVYNTKPATGWIPIRGQKKLPKINLNEELLRLGLLPNSITPSVFATDCRTYVNLIKSKQLNKTT